MAVRTFADLQALGFAPGGLSEAQVKRAIADDDMEALRTARTRCGRWSEAPEPEPEPTDRALRAAYDEIRAAQNPHLARVMSEQTGVAHSWDDTSARVLAGAMTKLTLQPVFIPLMLVQDIVVQRDATLRIDAGISLLRARDIRLYVGAKLVLHGPYTKVICRSVKGDLV